MDAAEILDKAKDIVTGERNETYGDVENNFDRIASLWTRYLGHEINADNVAVMMILLKIARINPDKPHMDNWVDIAGYAALGGKLEWENQ